MPIVLLKESKGPASLLLFSWGKTSQVGFMVLSTLCRKEALNAKSAHKQNEKEAFMRTSDKVEEFRVKAKVFLKLESKTVVQHLSLEREENIIRCLYIACYCTGSLLIHSNYTEFKYLSHLLFSDFFFPTSVYRKIEKLCREHPHTHHLDSTINILVYLFYRGSVHLLILLPICQCSLFFGAF